MLRVTQWMRIASVSAFWFSCLQIQLDFIYSKYIIKVRVQSRKWHLAWCPPPPYQNDHFFTLKFIFRESVRERGDHYPLWTKILKLKFWEFKKNFMAKPLVKLKCTMKPKALIFKKWSKPYYIEYGSSYFEDREFWEC